MAERNSNVQLLAVSADWGDVEDSEYRFLVDGKDVKYVTTAPGIFPKDDRTFAPILIPLLPQFPPGDWNEGHVTKNDITGELEFARATTAILPGVENNWHPVKVGHLELVKLERFHQNIDKVTHPRFSHPVVVKFAEFPWKIPQIELETTAYQHIDGSGIDSVEGSRTAAGKEDLAGCQRILVKLHGLGFKHGDINKHNFLVGNEGVLMIDFETTKKCEVKEELDEEYSRLEESLMDPSYRGIGPSTIGTSP